MVQRWELQFQTSFFLGGGMDDPVVCLQVVLCKRLVWTHLVMELGAPTQHSWVNLNCSWWSSTTVTPPWCQLMFLVPTKNQTKRRWKQINSDSLSQICPICHATFPHYWFSCSALVFETLLGFHSLWSVDGTLYKSCQLATDQWQSYACFLCSVKNLFHPCQWHKTEIAQSVNTCNFWKATTLANTLRREHTHTHCMQSRANTPHTATRNTHSKELRSRSAGNCAQSMNSWSRNAARSHRSLE